MGVCVAACTEVASQTVVKNSLLTGSTDTEQPPGRVLLFAVASAGVVAVYVGLF